MLLGFISYRKVVGKNPLSIHGIMIFLAAFLFLGSPQILIASSNDTAVDAPSGNNYDFDADKIVFNTTENSAELISNATITLEETVITADSIKIFFKKHADGGTPFNESSTENFEESFENVVAKGNVNILSEGRVASGDEAIYDRAAGKLVLTGNPATLTINEDMTSSSEINADSIVFNETEVSAEFTGNVSFTQEKTFIMADYVKAFFKKSADGGLFLNEGSAGNIPGSVEKIIANGNVKIVSEDAVATGDNAIYDSTVGSFVLTGDPATLVVGVLKSSAPEVEIIGKL